MQKKFDLSNRSNCTENLRLMCADLGEDIDSPLCQEVSEHIKTCKNCRAYVDTVKKTVSFFRTAESKRDVPPDVHERLWNVLNLKQ